MSGLLPDVEGHFLPVRIQEKSLAGLLDQQSDWKGHTPSVPSPHEYVHAQNHSRESVHVLYCYSQLNSNPSSEVGRELKLVVPSSFIKNGFACMKRKWGRQDGSAYKGDCHGA